MSGDELPMQSTTRKRSGAVIGASRGAPADTAKAAAGTLATGGWQRATPTDLVSAGSVIGNGSVASVVGNGTSPAPPARLTEEQRAALLLLASTTPTEIKRVAGDWKQKKKGDGKEKTHTLGKVGKVTTTGEASVGVGGGIYGGVGAKVDDLGHLGRAYSVLAEGGMVAGAELKLSGSVAKDLGPVVAKAQASLKAFAGAYVKAKGTAYVAKGDALWQLGAGVAGSVEGFAGGKVEADGSISFEGKGLGIELGVEGDAMVGMEGKAEGEAVIDLAAKRIAVGGAVSGLIGVRASGSVSGTAKLYGRDALKAKVGASVQAGVGGSASFVFKISRGVLTLNIGGVATLAGGGELTTEQVIDFKPIAVYVWRLAARRYFAMNPIDPQSSTELTDRNSKLRTSLRDYREKKLGLLKADRADNYAKIEKVQAYIDWYIDRHSLKPKKGLPGNTALDAEIKRVVELELSSRKDNIGVVVEVEYGKLTSLELVPDDAVDRLKAGKVTGKRYTRKPLVGASGKDLQDLGS